MKSIYFQLLLITVFIDSIWDNVNNVSEKYDCKYTKSRKYQNTSLYSWKEQCLNSLSSSNLFCSFKSSFSLRVF